MIFKKNHVVRLSKYKTVVKRMRALGMTKVFSENLADALGFTAAQVRKDFSILGITGHKKAGYQIDELMQDFNRLLGKEKIRDTVIVGYGNIGRAMAHYNGFEKEHIRITAAFDSDPSKQNPEATIPVFSLDRLIPYIQEHSIQLAIIAVPNTAAQEAINMLVNAGVIGVLNFASITPRVPEHVVVNNIDLNAAMETLTFYVYSDHHKTHRTAT